MFCITMAGAYYHGAAPWPVYIIAAVAGLLCEVDDT